MFLLLIAVHGISFYVENSWNFLVRFGEENSASILLGMKLLKKGTTLLSNREGVLRRVRSKKKVRGKACVARSKSTYGCDTKHIEKSGRNGENILVYNGEKINFSQRRKFPLSYEKITILPNRQLFMLNPLRTIGIFSLPIIILSVIVRRLF